MLFENFDINCNCLRAVRLEAPVVVYVPAVLVLLNVQVLVLLSGEDDEGKCWTLLVEVIAGRCKH